MNFFDVPVRALDGEAELKGDGFTLRVPGQRGRTIAAYNGRSLILGIRPEHFGRVGQVDDATHGELWARVEVVETMGSEQHLHLTLGAKSFVAKLDTSVRVNMGDDIRLVYAKDAGATFRARNAEKHPVPL